MKNVIAVIIGILAVVLGMAIGFGIISAIVYGICWAFNLTFSWKLVIGVYLVMMLIRKTLRNTVTVESEKN